MREVLGRVPLTQVSREGLKKAADVGDSYFMCLPCMPPSYREKTTSRKGLWTIAFSMSLFLCTCAMTLNFAQFFRFPVQTSLSIISAHQLDFPAVTICNHNPIRRTELLKLAIRDATDRQLGQLQEELRDYGWDIYWQVLENDKDIGAVYLSVHADNHSKEYLAVGSMLDTFLESVGVHPNDTFVSYSYQKFVELYTKLPIDERRERGHQIGEMLMSCRFNKEPCSHHQFLQTVNTVHGNCYSFTIGKDGPIKDTFITKIPGPTHGLELELYVDQQEYVHSITDVAGVRVVIHNQTYMPFADREGFTAAPGSATYVSLRRVDEHRASRPYGHCMEDDLSSHPYNHWRFEYPHISYSSTACRLSCYQKHFNDRCNCGDSRFPLLLLIGTDQSTNIYPCNTEEGRKCMSEVRESSLDCSECIPLCDEVSYKSEISFGAWPAIPREGEIRDKLKKLSDDFAREVDSGNFTDDMQIRYIRENALKLVIYLSDLEYESFNTETSYSWINLISDQGGQVGLWVGVSILTLVELVEVTWDCLAERRRRAKDKAKPPLDGYEDEVGEEAV